MKIRYFVDTDTIYVELTEKEVVETMDLNENTIVDLDANGNLVAITLEHARELANIYDEAILRCQADAGIFPSKLVETNSGGGCWARMYLQF